MTSLRAFQPQDLFNTNLTNLDPLTENYNVDFYLDYLIQWPSLFTVVEDQHGNITGYSEQSSAFFRAPYLYFPHSACLSPSHQALLTSFYFLEIKK